MNYQRLYSQTYPKFIIGILKHVLPTPFKESPYAMPKGGSSRRLALTPRDIDIFESIHEARYLSTETLEWLHFPQWRERYTQ